MVMTRDPWSPNSVGKSIIRTKRKWLSAKTNNSFKGVPFESCFLFRMFSVFLIKCGNDIYLSRLLNYTGWCHSNQCRALTQVLGGLLGPIDYFTNQGGGRDGIFLIIRHSNVMFSLVVGHSLPPH